MGIIHSKTTTFMKDSKLRSIAIVGGGIAGWMSAAILSRFLQTQDIDICLIEGGEDCDSIAMYHAALPQLQTLHETLGIDEREFLKFTRGGFKLGIQFCQWNREGGQYFHGFGGFGMPIEGVSPHHCWLKLKSFGDDIALGDYSLASVTAQMGNFSINTKNSRALLEHGFHFDPQRYVEFLRLYAQARGVRCLAGKVVDVKLSRKNGFIQTLQLKSGQAVQADFFIDCSGFRASIIEQALATGYQSWSHWLPADRAVSWSSNACEDNFLPYTKVTALPYGWQWRIPLQQSTVNGLVYSSHYLSDAAAADYLQQELNGKALGSPRFSQFVAGHRKRFWNKNCLAIGFAAAFLEPLECSGIELIQNGVLRLLQLFPDKRCDLALSAEYNRKTLEEVCRVRDLIVLHYATCAIRSELWQYCKHMILPPELERKLKVFASSGHVPLHREDFFQEPSWVCVLVGQNIVPKRYEPSIENIHPNTLRAFMLKRRAEISAIARNQPSHAAFVGQYCSV